MKIHESPTISTKPALKYDLSYNDIASTEGVYIPQGMGSVLLVVKEGTRSVVLWKFGNTLSVADSSWENKLFRKLPNAKVYLSIDTGEE